MPRKAHIRRMFNDIAPSYDRLNHLMSLDVDRLWRRRAVSCLVDGGPLRILDVACGTGDSTLTLVKASGEGSRVVGVDISEEMLGLAREKMEKAGVAGQVQLMEADGEALPFPDGAFDRVSCAFGIRNFEQIPLGLKEFRRVLVPGGKVVILELSMPRNPVVRACYRLYFLHILPWIGGKISHQEAAYRYLPASVVRFPAPESFCGMLRDAGFTDVRHKSLSLGLCRLFTAQA